MPSLSDSETDTLRLGALLLAAAQLNNPTCEPNINITLLAQRSVNLATRIFELTQPKDRE